MNPCSSLFVAKTVTAAKKISKPRISGELPYYFLHIMRHVMYASQEKNSFLARIPLVEIL